MGDYSQHELRIGGTVSWSALDKILAKHNGEIAKSVQEWIDSDAGEWDARPFYDDEHLVFQDPETGGWDIDQLIELLRPAKIAYNLRVDGRPGCWGAHFRFYRPGMNDEVCIDTDDDLTPTVNVNDLREFLETASTVDAVKAWLQEKSPEVPALPRLVLTRNRKPVDLTAQEPRDPAYTRS
jgi:hypothetical protein